MVFEKEIKFKVNKKEFKLKIPRMHEYLLLQAPVREKEWLGLKINVREPTKTEVVERGNKLFMRNLSPKPKPEEELIVISNAMMIFGKYMAKNIEVN